MRAGAVPGARDLHGRQDAEADGERDGDGGAGGSGQFERGPAGIDRRVDEQPRGSRGGDGQESVLGLDGAAADVERRADHGIDVQMVEGHAGADDIGDGIGRADLMKVDLLDGDLVDFGLRLAEPLEDGDGVLPGARGNGGLLDHLDDVREVAVDVLMLHVDVVLGGADAGALDLFERHGSAGVEGGDGVDDGRLVSTGVGESADQHVAANSRKCVQITGYGHVTSIVTGEAYCDFCRRGADKTGHGRRRQSDGTKPNRPALARSCPFLTDVQHCQD